VEHKIRISKTARYFTYGNPETAENIWIVLHGYSQLAQFFIKKFHGLNPDKNFVVAPEGFHRFYRSGASGRVGASWMTKEARLDDIEDNIKYLDELVSKILANKNYKNKILLGFSQGGATASRWHQKGNYNANHFIIWGSVYAEDLSFEEDKTGLFESNNYFVVGKDDVFFKGKIDAIKDYFNQQKFTTHVELYEGGHDIDSGTLLHLAKKIK